MHTESPLQSLVSELFCQYTGWQVHFRTHSTIPKTELWFKQCVTWWSISLGRGHQLMTRPTVVAWHQDTMLSCYSYCKVHFIVTSPVHTPLVQCTSHNWWLMNNSVTEAITFLHVDHITVCAYNMSVIVTPLKCNFVRQAYSQNQM